MGGEERETLEGDKREERMPMHPGAWEAHVPSQAELTWEDAP